jgi:DNA-binding protein Rv2175c, wHTH domain
LIAERAPRKGFLWRYIEASREHGALLPLPLVGEALQVSKQRVHQLINDGQLAFVPIGTRKFVPAAVLELFMTEDRKTGVHLSRRWIYTGGGVPVLKKRS